MKWAMWDVSLKDGTKTFGHTMARALNADIISNRGRCKTAQDLITKLDAYDRILMSSVQWHSEEKGSVDDAWHVQVSRRLGHKLVPACHMGLNPGAPYNGFVPKAALPFTLEILKNCRVVWTLREELIGDHQVGEHLVAWPYIPRFAPSLVEAPQGPPGLWSTSRVKVNDGQKNVDAPLRAGFRGRYFVAGESYFDHVTRLQKLAEALGGKTTHQALNGRGNIGRSTPWTVEWPTGGGVAYLGKYDNPADLKWEWASAHIAYVPKRHIDTVTIEAMAYGRRCISPEWTIAGLGYKTIIPWDGTDDSLHDAIEQALSLPHPTREELNADVALNDPMILAQKLNGTMDTT
jgi:hypothetical protein